MQGTCVANGATCGRTMCVDGGCGGGTCGGLGQPCCNGGVCTSGNTRCLMNTCQHCGTVLGNWPLHEALTEFLAEGGSLDELVHVPSGLPGDALDQLEE